MTAERRPATFGTQAARGARAPRRLAAPDCERHEDLRRVLEALERNDISKLPGGIFSRAFVRSYAVEVGLDPEADHPGVHRAVPERLGRRAGIRTTDQRRGSRGARERSPDGDGVSSADCDQRADRRRCACTSVTAGRSVRSPAPPPHERGARRSACAGAGAPRGAAARLVAGARACRVANDGARQRRRRRQRAVAPDVAVDLLRVGLTATAPVGCRRWSTGRRPIERLLQAGEQNTIEVRHEIVLTAGDAGAMTLTLNGADARPLGKAGEVVTARLNLTNFKDYPGRHGERADSAAGFLQARRGRARRAPAGRAGRARAARARTARASWCCCSRIPIRRSARPPTRR